MKTKKRLLFVEPKGNDSAITLNWAGTPRNEFNWYGEAFHQSAQVLLANLKADPSFTPSVFPADSFKSLPILFNYRHAMELYFKGVILEGAPVIRFLGKQEIDLAKVLETHSLLVLLGHYERISDACKWPWDFGKISSRAEFRTLITELDTVDRGSYAFRYPTKKDGQNSPLDRSFRFDLFHFCEILDSVFPYLDGAASAACEQASFLSDMEREARSYDLEYPTDW